MEPSICLAETGTKFDFLDIRKKANKNKHEKVISWELYLIKKTDKIYPKFLKWLVTPVEVNASACDLSLTCVNLISKELNISILQPYSRSKILTPFK